MQFFDPLELRTTAQRETQVFQQLEQNLQQIKQMPIWQELYQKIPLNLNFSWQDFKAIPVLYPDRWAQLHTSYINHPQSTHRMSEQDNKRFVYQNNSLVQAEANSFNSRETARALFAAGIRPYHRVYNAFTNQHLLEEMVLDGGLTVLGCKVLANIYSNQQKLEEQQAQAIASFNPDFYLGSYQQLTRLLAHTPTNHPVHRLQRAIFCDVEITQAQREYLENTYGIKTSLIYIRPEIGCVAYESIPYQGWLINENIWVDIVYPGSASCVEFGEIGEVVLTRLDTVTCPVIRLATGLLSAFKESQSGCGRTALRLAGYLGFTPQSEDSTFPHITPEQLQTLTLAFTDIAKLRLKFKKENNEITSTLYCETGLRSTTLQQAILNQLTQLIPGKVSVRLCDLGTLPTDGLLIEYPNSESSKNLAFRPVI